jgi:hypothetical protein
MCKSSKFILTAAMAASLVLGLSGVASAADSATFTGQGTTGGKLNNEVNQDGEPYILFIYQTDKSAKNATITINGAEKPMVKFGNGTFKYEADWALPNGLIGKVTASSDGTSKNARLLISHGFGADTNLPPSGNNIDPATGSGTTDNKTVGATFTMLRTFTTDKSWNSWDIGIRGDYRQHRMTEQVDKIAVNATPIYGDYTGELVGYTVDSGGWGKLIENVVPVHWTADSVPYLYHVALPIDEQQTHNVTYSDLTVIEPAVPAEPVA